MMSWFCAFFAFVFPSSRSGGTGGGRRPASLVRASHLRSFEPNLTILPFGPPAASAEVRERRGYELSLFTVASRRAGLHSLSVPRRSRFAPRSPAKSLFPCSLCFHARCFPCSPAAWLYCWCSAVLLPALSAASPACSAPPRPAAAKLSFARACSAVRKLLDQHGPPVRSWSRHLVV